VKDVHVEQPDWIQGQSTAVAGLTVKAEHSRREINDVMSATMRSGLTILTALKPLYE